MERNYRGVKIIWAQKYAGVDISLCSLSANRNESLKKRTTIVARIFHQKKERYSPELLGDSNKGSRLGSSSHCQVCAGS